MTDFEAKVLEFLGDIKHKLSGIESYISSVSDNTYRCNSSLEDIEETLKVIEKQTENI